MVVTGASKKETRRDWTRKKSAMRTGCCRGSTTRRSMDERERDVDGQQIKYKLHQAAASAADDAAQI